MKIKLDENALAPTRAHGTDAGIDLCTPYDFTIEPHGEVLIKTGIHVQLPKNTVGYIRSKSGLMVYKGVITDGTIDEGYTGEIGVVMFNLSDMKWKFKRGEKIAQLVVQPVLYPGMIIADELDESERGENGFGSTGN